MTLKLNSLSQSGGVIINNSFSFKNDLLKPVVEGDKFSYENIGAYSNEFNKEQLKSIKVFINFILPYITYKGKKLGLESIKNIETLYGGSFGMTLVYDDIVIKISKSTINNDQDHANEISGLENLFRIIPDGVPPPPNTLSKYYGFMSHKKTTLLSKYSTYRGKMNVFTNIFTNPLFTIDEAEIFANAKNLGGEDFLSGDFLNTMVIIFLERDDMNLSKFINTVMKNLSPVQKMEMVQIFLNDMTEALNYLHRSRLLIHCDIKPDNLVVSEVSNGSYKFKLIDFGSLTNIDRITGIAVPGSNPPRTPVFFKETFHENTLSFAYDEYCVLFSALMMLGIDYSHIFVNYISQISYTMMIKSDKKPQIVNEIINKINQYYPTANLLKFEDSTLTSRAKEGYKSLLAFLLTAPCKSGRLINFR